MSWLRWGSLSDLVLVDNWSCKETTLMAYWIATWLQAADNNLDSGAAYSICTDQVDDGMYKCKWTQNSMHKPLFLQDVQHALVSRETFKYHDYLGLTWPPTHPPISVVKQIVSWNEIFTMHHSTRTPRNNASLCLVDSLILFSFMDQKWCNYKYEMI